MNTEREKTWVQCQECGEVYQMPQTIDIDKLYIWAHCPICNHMTRGLNLGDNEDDVYYLYDVTLDERYYP